MTKQEMKEYQKKWYQDNKEKQKEYDQEYYNDNKEEVAAQQKLSKDSHKDGLYTVYLLPKENYVGMTTNLHIRIRDHRTKHNRDTTDVQIIGKYHTKDEAVRIEASYHNEGFKGAWGFQQRMEEFNKPEAIARRKEIEKELLLIGKKFNLI